jgi:signal transduction histidine kinase/DNA-binding response OmpR family regulator
MELPILSVRLQFEHDVVAARQRAKQTAKLLGFDAQMQTRLATAVSEIARNAFSYGGGGKVEFSIEGVTSPQLFQVRITDHGPGISSLPQIMEGSYRSPTGMGLGMVGAQRLMDRFTVDTAPGKGTVVTLSKLLPRNAPLVRQQTLGAITEALAAEKPSGLLEEFRDQNQELLRTLDELRRRQDELVTLNRELEDTNRGVVALYAELDERADHLRRADEVKTRFLSNMSHEFRTPLNSMLALSRLLLERSDGDLTDEQEKQVSYIRKSAESLSELVNDLLDLSKAEAGKIVIYPAEFSIENLFGALRGMLRPLLAGTSVSLVFEVPEGMPLVFSDEAKVSQILRNFISNALKFTESGEVRVTAAFSEAIDSVVFTVSDTGIGIAPEDLDSIFQEFTQIDSQLQRKVKGTGLGLPLSKKLAELLQGSIGAESQVGVGSTFWATVPRLYQPGEKPVQVETLRRDPARQPVLLIEDHFETRLIYEKFLRASHFQIIAARTVREAQSVLDSLTPAAIILDILLQGENAWAFLARLKADPKTSDIPIIVATSVDDQRKALALGADRYALKPIAKATLLDMLGEVSTVRSEKKRVLIIDDEEISRYLVRQLFAGANLRFIEARNGSEGLYAAGAERPDLIVLDLAMPDMTGYEVLRQLKSNPATMTIPVIVATSRILSSEEQRQLLNQVFAIFPKADLAGSASAEKFRVALASAGLDDVFAIAAESALGDLST